MQTCPHVKRSAAKSATRVAHYSRVALSLAIAVLLTFASGYARAQRAFTAEVETRIIALVNDIRAQRELKPLERELRLDRTAEYFAGYIANSGTLEHTADGSTPAARVKQRGYLYCMIAENLAYEYSSRGFTADRLARNFTEGWRDSPTHRENMLDATVTQTGVGVARNARGEYYAVQLFGLPPTAGARKGAACRG